MNANPHTHTLAALAAISLTLPLLGAAPGEAKLHRLSATIERERPELNEATRSLIAAYREQPSEANRAALRAQIAKNYDAIVARKKAKLEELRKTARHRSKVDEMKAIVDEMLADREARIAQSLARFSDPRLRPGTRTSPNEGYLPLIGAASNLNMAYAPVTNEDYARFVAATGHAAPKGWTAGKVPEGKARHPVTGVSHADAVAYCQWLTRQGKAHYRLPTEAEWEIAAGHMPKDADLNCGEHSGTLPVDAYAKTLAACGAIDMWGNCWEWTSSDAAGGKVVKGGAYDSPRTACRTEHRGEARAAGQGYANVSFRVVRVD